MPQCSTFSRGAERRVLRRVVLSAVTPLSLRSARFSPCPGPVLAQGAAADRVFGPPNV